MRELTRGLVFASLALLTVLAGLTLALSGNRGGATTPRAPSQAAPTETLFVPSPVLPSRTPIDAFALLQTQALDASPTPCPLPAGWERTTVADGDSLAGLAAGHGLSLAAFLQGNCLDHDSFYIGAIIYLPITTPTLAPSPACGPPPGWGITQFGPATPCLPLAFATASPFTTCVRPIACRERPFLWARTCLCHRVGPFCRLRALRLR